MRIVGPEAITVGAATLISDPAQLGGNPSLACQIQNSSGYQLTVLAAGVELSIQPYTAQTVEISGQPISVLPIASTSSGTCTLTFVFLLGAPPSTGVTLPDGTEVEAPPQADGPLTAAAILALNAPPGQVYNGPLTGGGPINITVPQTARTLIINAKTSGTILTGPGITVIGTTTGYVYQRIYYLPGPVPAAPYLFASSTSNYLLIVPVSPTIDPVVQIEGIWTGTGTVSLDITADSQIYDESIFYNGPLSVAAQVASNDTLTIITGPCRLLNASLTIAGAGEGALTVAGQNLLTAFNAAGDTTNYGQSIGFPPNTVLPNGATVTVYSSGAGVNVAGAVTYAYP